MQIGTQAWIEEFKKAFMHYEEATAPKIIKIYENGTKLMNDFKYHESWTIPFKVLDKEGLDIRMPDNPDFDVIDVVKLIGSDHHEDTIDVFAQETYKMSLGRFQALWSEKERERLYNILSLEFSGTALAPFVQSPQLVRNLSWEDKFWHHNEVNDENQKKQPEYDQPAVSYFCLMGMAGSYTNWHLDFGGSSVWYHVFEGSKVFLIARPTDQNLEAFMRWQTDKKHTETFFGDLLPSNELYRLHLNKGETLFLPSGWIHSVYTPVDSIVFGGNFLHNLSVPMQFKVYEMEAKVRTEERFRFPCFEICNFLAAENLLKEKNLGDPVLKEAAAALVKKCTFWLKKAPYSFSSFANVPRELDKRINKI